MRDEEKIVIIDVDVERVVLNARQMCTVHTSHTANAMHKLL